MRRGDEAGLCYVLQEMAGFPSPPSPACLPFSLGGLDWTGKQKGDLPSLPKNTFSTEAERTGSFPSLSFDCWGEGGTTVEY